MIPRAALETPLQAIWTITSRCNLACPYCLEDAPRGPATDVPEERRALIARELIAHQVLKVLISGGEPLLVPTLREHLTTLRGHGVAVDLTTNGLLLDAAWASELARLKVSKVELSLHRGAGRAVRHAMRLLHAQGVPVLLRITLTPYFESHLERTVTSLARAGAKRISIQEAMPLGRGLRNRVRCTVGLEAQCAVQGRLDRLGEELGLERLRFTSASLGDAQSGQPNRCELGRSKLKSCEIRPDGNVTPCGPTAALGIANYLHEKGLAACWQDLGALYGHLGAEREQPWCRGCQRLVGCPAGCPVMGRELWEASKAPLTVCPFYRLAGPAPQASTNQRPTRPISDARRPRAPRRHTSS